MTGPWRRLAGGALVILAGGAAASCVQIDTPDRPIEINLNINIRQEVVYRLDRDAKALIEEQSGIF